MATTEQIYNEALKERVSTAPEFTWADWQQYQTARFKDDSLWIVNTWTWQLASWTWYFNDTQREAMKQKVMWTPTWPNTTTAIPTQTANAWDLYSKWIEWIQWKISQTWQDLQQAIAGFNKSNIAEWIRLKTWWTKDLDASIENLKMELNKARPDLMKKYADVVDPKVREQLINAEEKRIWASINNLNAIREYRIGTIKDMIEWEIADKEQTIKWLEAQYNLYRNVMWDLKEADKTKREIEKYALDMEKSKLELQQYKDMLPLKQREAQLWLMWKEQELWVEWSPGSTSYWQTDITDLATKYPNNASIKNNNPGNIKYNPSWFNQILDKAWIQYTVWTGATDWWNFLKFKSVEDWLVARSLLLKWDSYKNLSVDQAMKRWSNNWYWAEILPGINANTKIKDLSNEQLANLMNNQIKREDSVMYKELVNRWIDPAKIITPWEYKKTDATTQKIDKNTDFTKIVNDVDSYLKYNKSIPKWITDKLSTENADNILKSDNELKLKNDKILDLASDEAYNEYMTKVDIDELSNMKDWNEIINYIKDNIIKSSLWVKDAEFNKMSEEDIKNSLQDSDKEYIRSILEQSWVNKLEWFRESAWKFFWWFRRKYFDKLQDLWIY